MPASAMTSDASPPASATRYLHEASGAFSRQIELPRIRLRLDPSKVIPDKDTPIYTLCRTGMRSVSSGNRLTDAGYTNFRNIWEGFVGVGLMAPAIEFRIGRSRML